jgi:hypothetical protein
MSIPKFLHIGFNWSGLPKVDELKAVFDIAHDWLRYAPNCWIVWTTSEPVIWHNRLVPHITNKDRFLVIEVDPKNKQGWEDKFVWEWLNKDRSSLFPLPPEK